MKRTALSLCVGLMLALSLTACSRNKAPAVTPTPTPSPTVSPTASPSPAVTPSIMPDVTFSPDGDNMMDDGDYSADSDGTVDPDVTNSHNGSVQNGMDRAGNAIGDIANGVGNAAKDITNGVGNALR